jgi:farnesyl diphosphate synthase
MKTGALLSFSVEAGTRLGGAGAKPSAALKAYGRAIGRAFQIADDILDAEGDAATLGKRARKDAQRNKATLVGALGLEGARRELARLVGEANSALDASGLGSAGDVLRATARFVATRNK